MVVLCGGICHSTGCLRNRGGAGDFHRPYETLKFLSAYEQRSTLPQSRIRSTAPSEREPGNVPPQCQSPARWMLCQRAGDFCGFCVGVGTFYHSTGCLRNRGVTGDFHRPYEALNVSHFTIQRTTLPQSRIRSTAPSESEPGNAPHNVNYPPAGYFVSGRVIFGGSVWGRVLPFNRVLAKPWGCGRFSSPLRNSKTVSFYHSSDDTPSVSHSLDSSLREGAGRACTIQWGTR